MKQLDSITGTMLHKYHVPYNGLQTIDVYQNTDGTICINGVFGYSKDYPTLGAALSDIQHRHGFTFVTTAKADNYHPIKGHGHAPDKD